MYDLAVIGGGSGGYVAAIRAAQNGLKTLLIEKDTLGGTCLNRGCIPTKCFVHDTKLFHGAKTSSLLKGADSLSFDVRQMVSRKRGVVKTLVGGLDAIMRSHGIEVAQGVGEVIAPGRLRVIAAGAAAREVQAKHIVLAMGSKPAVPPFIKPDGRLVQTTDDALDLEEIPRTIAIIGGGVIGIEMASIYLNLGCQVTILEMLPDILNTEDKDVRLVMKGLLTQQGARIHLNARAAEVKTEAGEVQIAFLDEAGKQGRLKADRLLVAAGRTPVLEGVRPDRLGLKMNGPCVKVNNWLETGVPGLYAVGDLVGGMMLAHKASAEAEAAVANVMGARRAIDPARVPRCIWGITEIGAVGMSEEEARSAGRSCKVGKFPYAYSGAAQAMGKGDGLAKIVADSLTGEILGVHIIGEHATDLIGEAVMAMNTELAIEDLAEAIKPHPTLSENLMEAARDWNGLAVHTLKKR